MTFAEVALQCCCMKTSLHYLLNLLLAVSLVLPTGWCCWAASGTIPASNPTTGETAPTTKCCCCPVTSPVPDQPEPVAPPLMRCCCAKVPAMPERPLVVERDDDCVGRIETPVALPLVGMLRPLSQLPLPPVPSRSVQVLHCLWLC